MIRVQCPQCGSKLNAKEKLAGQTRSCPQCGAPVTIPQPAKSEESTPQIVLANPAAERLPSEGHLQHLDRTNRYLICDRSSVIAQWRNDGRGWMYRIASGFVPARRNREALTSVGQFVLVELQMEATDAGQRLAAIEAYGLSRFAVARLSRGDDDVLGAIIGFGRLSREQKNVVRQMLGELFMRDVWGDSHEVLDFLANNDYHSHSSRAQA